MAVGRSQDKLHEMHEFGTVYGATQEVRVNRLEDRLDPLVPFPHRHDFYHLVVVTNGQGWHEIDFHQNAVGPFQIFFMKPGQVHSWQLHPKTAGFVVEFGSDALFEKTIDQLPDHIDLALAPKGVRDSFFKILELMLHEYEKRGAEFESSLRHYLVPVFIELNRASPEKTKAKPTSDPLLNQFLRLSDSSWPKTPRSRPNALPSSTEPSRLSSKRKPSKRDSGPHFNREPSL